MPISDLLNGEQLRDVCAIVEMEPDSYKRVRKLQAYLQPLAAQLEPKGVLPDFLAYAIEHSRSEFTK
jgi:hypothetical protein